jgi:hypothetical protein
VQVLDGKHLLQAVDLPELVHELKPRLVSHYSNITIMGQGTARRRTPTASPILASPCPTTPPELPRVLLPAG